MNNKDKKTTAALSALVLLMASCQGPQGLPGIDGVDGKDGANGTNGLDGQDGQDGQDGVNGTDGKDGINGQDGKDGQDGKPAAVMHPLWLGTLPVTLEDQTGKLESSRVDFFQDDLTLFTQSTILSDVDTMQLLLNRGKSLRIIIEDVHTAYGDGIDYRVIDGRTFAIWYDFAATAPDNWIGSTLSKGLTYMARTPLAANLSISRTHLADAKPASAKLLAKSVVGQVAWTRRALQQKAALERAKVTDTILSPSSKTVTDTIGVNRE